MIGLDGRRRRCWPRRHDGDHAQAAHGRRRRGRCRRRHVGPLRLRAHGARAPRPAAPPWHRRLTPWLFLAPAILLVSALPGVPGGAHGLDEPHRKDGTGSPRPTATRCRIRRCSGRSATTSCGWCWGPPGSVGIGLAFAALMDRVRRESLAKTFIFLPLAISFVGASVIWRFVYAWRPPVQPQIGILNAVVVAAGRRARARGGADPARRHPRADRDHGVADDGLRHGGAVRRDQGRADRHAGGRPHRRGQRAAGVLPRVVLPPDQGHRADRRDDRRDRGAEGLRHRLRHDRRQPTPTWSPTAWSRGFSASATTAAPARSRSSSCSWSCRPQWSTCAASGSSRDPRSGAMTAVEVRPASPEGARDPAAHPRPPGRPGERRHPALPSRGHDRDRRHGPVVAADHRPAHQLVPAVVGDRLQRLVDRGAAPVRGGAVDAARLRRRAGQQWHGRRVREQPHGHDPGGAAAAERRRVRRLRVRVDALPGRRVCSRWWSACSSSRCR